MNVMPFPPPSHRFSHREWMGQRIETLILGYTSVAPILGLPQYDNNNNSTEEGGIITDEAIWGGSTPTTFHCEYVGKYS
jgi:hypothetical protein